MAGEASAFPAIDLQISERPKPMKLVRRTALGAALGLMLSGAAWAGSLPAHKPRLQSLPMTTERETA